MIGINDPLANGPRAMPYAIAIALLGLAIVLPVTLLPGGTDAAVAERFAQMDADFGALPDWVTRWMSFQHFIFAGSLLFFVLLATYINKLYRRWYSLPEE